jgi:hypothetical protein
MAGAAGAGGVAAIDAPLAVSNAINKGVWNLMFGSSD